MRITFRPCCWHFCLNLVKGHKHILIWGVVTFKNPIYCFSSKDVTLSHIWYKPHFSLRLHHQCTHWMYKNEYSVTVSSHWRSCQGTAWLVGVLLPFNFCLLGRWLLEFILIYLASSWGAFFFFMCEGVRLMSLKMSDLAMVWMWNN